MSSASDGNGAPDAVPDGTHVGAQLKAARLAARMSMAEVAEQAGLTKGFVSKLERDLSGERITLEQGDAFTFPANTPQTFGASPQAARTQVLWVVSPALPDAPHYAQPPESREGTG